MSRRRRRKEPRRPKGPTSTQWMTVLVLAAMLAIILVFRQNFSERVSVLMNQFGGPSADLQPTNTHKATQDDKADPQGP